MQDGKREFGALIETVKHIAFKYGPVGIFEADDITQMTMLRVLKKKDGAIPTLGWLCKAVRSVATDAARSLAYERRFLSRTHDVSVVCEEHVGYQLPVIDPKRADIEIDLMPRLKKVLAQLSKPARQVLLLYAEGYSYKAIAVMTNTSIGTVRSRLHYARKHAVDMLKEYI